MSKKLGTDKRHQKTCSNDRKKLRHQKKTDSPTEYEYQIDNIENLFLYCLGKSPNPLAISEVEEAVGWEMEGSYDKNNRKEKPKFRRNYVYEIEKKLFHQSEFIPSALIFTTDDFLKYEMEEYKIHLPEMFKEKLTKFFKCLFYLDLEASDLSFEVNDHYKIENYEIVKAINIFDNKSNYLRIEINYSNLQDNLTKKAIDTKPKGLQKNDLRLFIGSSLTVSETELNVHKKREKGRLAIRYFDIFPKIHLKNYIDIIPTNARKKYVLNLRGFLKYLSSYDKGTDSFKKLNRVIENLSGVDEYWDIQCELLGFNNAGINLIQEAENFNAKQQQHEHKIKKRFPFLSFYNQYKDYLPTNYAAQILIKAGMNLKDKLETFTINELKYQVTEFFFTEIEDYFWESVGFSEPRIKNGKLISDTPYDILKEYQSEIRYYLGKIKEMESKRYIQQSEYYEEYNSENELKKKILKYLDENQKPVIWIKEILYPKDSDSLPLGLTANEISVIREICESTELGYVTNKGFFLIKETEIEKIKGRLESMMSLEMAKKIIYNHGISNETAIMDAIVLSGFKTLRGIGKIQKI